MKIAIPTRNNKVDDHFGHCEYYTIYEMDNSNKVLREEVLAAPPMCGCKSGIAQILADAGVEIMLAGNMGMGALNKLNQTGIQVIRGCNGSVSSVIDNYIKEGIKDSGETCHAHGDDHQCSH